VGEHHGLRPTLGAGHLGEHQTGEQRLYARTEARLEHEQENRWRAACR